MERHSGKPLYLSIAPRFITNRGVFCFVRMFSVHESLTLLIQYGIKKRHRRTVHHSSLTSYASHPVVNITINIIEQGNQWAFVLHTFGVKLFNFPTMGFMLADLNYEELA